MAKYRLTEDGVTNTEAGSHIPNDSDNTSWREYLQWTADGGVADPIAPRHVRTADEAAEHALKQTDDMMIRTIDWLLGELVRKGTIDIDDVPPRLKSLYRDRKALRGA